MGENTEFKIYEDSSVDPYLELIAGEERRGGGAAAAEAAEREGDGEAAPAEEGSMETD